MLLQRRLDGVLHRRLRRPATAARPAQAQPRDAVGDAEQLDVAAVGLHVRPHGVQRLGHALLEADGIQAVGEHEAGDDLVRGEPRDGLLVERREDPLEALAVEPDELLRLGRELVRALGQVAHQHIPVGVCTTLRTFPLPVVGYMWTPHGRHGSKEWTARMMSTPLKSSGPFSSKIGVFCTASS